MIVAKAVLLLAAISVNLFACKASLIPDDHWDQYKVNFNKSYESKWDERFARIYFNVNKAYIAQHNFLYSKGLSSYSLALNQFSDMPFTFSTKFPQTAAAIPTNTDQDIPSSVVPDSFDYSSNGFSSAVQDQGLKCYSGWAYATAAALQIFKAAKTGEHDSKELSAQNLIDCAGREFGCTTETPQAAFEFLTKHNQPLHDLNDYDNTPATGQGMCLIPQRAGSLNVTKISKYTAVHGIDDEGLKKVIALVSPVVVEYNPASFEFLHYFEGVFSQPMTVGKGTHFMTAVGYGTDASGRDYWKIQNSFGSKWGEGGHIRILRNAKTPLTSSAYYPSSL